MKPSEILRSLADIIDSVEPSKPSASAEVIQVAEPKTIAVSDTNGELAQQPDDVFVPPLQLKMELLKKATGVENIYDEPEDEEDEQHSYNELETIKRNAGINPVTLDALGDTEPLDV